MKSSILSTTVAALLGFCPVALAQEPPKTEPPKTATSSSVTTNADGTATVTIEVNGKKETRTFKLGGEEPFTLKLEDANASAGASAKHKAPPKKQKEAYIGVAMGAPVSDAVRAQLPIQPGEGISVSHVAPESPAAKAGIEQHDILVRLDDQILVSPDQFKTLITMRKPGDVLKIGFFRKGERKEASVTLTEHEVTESRDVLRWMSQPHGKWEEKLHDLKEKSGAWREKLKEAKDKFPGVVVDKQAFILGVDGTVKKLEGELENLEGTIRNLSERLEKANIPKETIERVRAAVEDAIQKAGDTAAKAAIDALEDLREKKDKTVEPYKVSPRPTPPAPPAPPVPPAPPAPPAQ